ncbi:DUF3530 family protein [Cellvibrio japonicus]|nr:DUF3530 family protein [Cellvibrio japonicus]
MKTIACGLLILAMKTPCLAQTPPSDPTPPPTNTTVSESSSSSTSSLSTLDRRLRAKELLADALTEESHWLETTEGKILALFRPTEDKVTKGALLLLHAAEDPQSWPPELENLRQKLPQYGWETLAISLPQAYAPEPPKRELAPAVESQSSSSQADDPNTSTNAETTNASSSQSSSSTPTEDKPHTVAREQLIKAYILAALNFLNQKGRFNLVVLVDNSSLYWCMQLLSPSIKTNTRDPNTVDGPLQALVITNLQPQEPLTTAELEASFSQSQLPVMDIFFGPDNSVQQAQRDKHRAVAMRNKLQHYQQTLLEAQPKVVEDDSNSFLLARIRGFMEKKARGTEIQAKEVKNQP